jgi:hypothetical protein
MTQTAATATIHCPDTTCTGTAVPPTPGTTEQGHYCETCGRAWNVEKVERDGRLRLAD